jgi:hypothetical protein
MAVSRRRRRQTAAHRRNRNVGKTIRAKPKPKRGRPKGTLDRPPATNKGVVVSVGPANLDNEVIKYWVTFPVTPESIPIASAATWESKAIIGLGEVADFGGRVLQTVQFSGMLEPVARYRGDGEPIMQRGAQVIGNTRYEPHAFKDLMIRAMHAGEIVRVIVGDDLGWNKLCSIREFAWRYEDPDPDTLYFDVSFSEHRPRRLAGVKTRRKPKHRIYQTKYGDTLKSVATKQWGDITMWKYLFKLNRRALMKLWYDPDDFRDNRSVGDRKTKGSYNVRDKRTKGKFDIKEFRGDTRFRAGVRLQMFPKPKKGKGKGKDKD